MLVIRLHTSGTPHGVNDVIVASVTRRLGTEAKVWLLEGLAHPPMVDGHISAAVLATSSGGSTHVGGAPSVTGIPSLSHLSEGDIVAVTPRGRINTLFRNDSPHNALFVTSRCNSNCLMCSQPPRDQDDLDYLYALNFALVPQIPKATAALGITGGEPTLLGSRLPRLLALLHRELPETAIHMLTNGRALAWPEVAAAIGEVAGTHLTMGVPLYSDHAAGHDYIVQANDAFSQTIRGLHNAARWGLHIEIRIVLHQLTFERLPAIVRFIHKNFPFAEHVAIMGMEDTGYARHNYALLAIEPEVYCGHLQTAVDYLTDFGMNVSLYNMPLCTLPASLRAYARTSISDWKREYLPACEGCQIRDDCGGVFGTSLRHSSAINAVRL